MAQTHRRMQRRILCVEDDHESARLIAEELLDWGFEVDIAYNGHEAIAAIEKEWPDLVLCDICMLGMSGFEVLERVTALAPRFGKIHFEFLTALTELDNEFKGRQLGADDYVTTPIDFDVLVTIITARFPTKSNAVIASMDLIGTSDLGLSWG
jgi:DNA-binding response OmpR family regulator